MATAPGLRVTSPGLLQPMALARSGVTWGEPASQRERAEQPDVTSAAEASLAAAERGRLG